MLTIVRTATNYGLRPIEIDVEVNVAEKGFPTFTIVGMTDKCSNEIKERVKTAIINSDIEFPMARITVNLAPADLPKSGSSYDLPIAIGILAARDEVKLPKTKCYFYGELSLDGKLRHTNGVFLLTILAREKGVKEIYVPRVCANEASVIKEVGVYPIDNLKELVRHLNNKKRINPLFHIDRSELLMNVEAEYDFNEICGQEQAKRAMEIAMAGGHNLFMCGPPGAGKTMLARAACGILPDLTEKESLEVTKIFSITGNIPEGGSLVRHRPFRSPHHTTSLVGLIGGGSMPRPGEITLSHRGVLFLDELPEYGRNTLEALRQPLEDGKVSISRAAGSVEFPAKFMLIAAANPCPCGYLGDTSHECKCNVHQIMNYQKKLSGPIMDRIDLHVAIPMVDVSKLMSTNTDNGCESSAAIKKRVANARNIQKSRFQKLGDVYCNADMKNRHLVVYADLSIEAKDLLKQAVNKYALSARAYFRLIKVARTIADLGEQIKIKEPHVAEALQFRIRHQ